MGLETFKLSYGKHVRLLWGALSLVASIISLAFAGGLIAWILKQPRGNEK